MVNIIKDVYESFVMSFRRVNAFVVEFKPKGVVKFKDYQIISLESGNILTQLIIYA